MLNSCFPSVFGDTPDATGLSLDEAETLYVPLGPRRARQQRAGLMGAVAGGGGTEKLLQELSLFIGVSPIFGQENTRLSISSLAPRE